MDDVMNCKFVMFWFEFEKLNVELFKFEFDKFKIVLIDGVSCDAWIRENYNIFNFFELV